MAGVYRHGMRYPSDKDLGNMADVLSEMKRHGVHDDVLARLQSVVTAFNNAGLCTVVKLLLRPSAIAAARSIAIGLSSLKKLQCRLFVADKIQHAPDQSRASIWGRDLISPGVANGTAVAVPSSRCSIMVMCGSLQSGIYCLAVKAMG